MRLTFTWRGSRIGALDVRAVIRAAVLTAMAATIALVVLQEV